MRLNIIGLLVFLSTFFTASAEKFDSIGHKVIAGKNFTLHRVKAGETLYGISKRYKIGIETIKTANPNFSGLRGGDTLLVPAKIIIKAPVVIKRSVKGHTVQAGETLYSISKKYKTTVEEIKRLNNLKDNSVSEGQLVLVAAPKTTDEAIADNKKKAESVPEEEATRKDEVKKDKSAKGISIDGMVNENGTARIAKSDKLDPQRNFILHPKAKIGSIVELVNPKNNRAVFVRVVGAFNVGSIKNQNTGLYISKKTATKLGIPSGGGMVTVKYRK